MCVTQFNMHILRLFNKLRHSPAYMQLEIADRKEVEKTYNQVAELIQVNYKKLYDLYKEHICDKYIKDITNRDPTFFLEADPKNIPVGLKRVFDAFRKIYELSESEFRNYLVDYIYKITTQLI